MFVHEKPDNLVDLFEESAAKYPDNPLFGTKNPKGDYEWSTYAQVKTRIDNLRSGLAGIGVQAGDAVGLIAKNREEWAVAAFATFGLKARFIPMYENELLSNWKYILNHGDVKVLLASRADIRDQILGVKDEIPGLERVFVMEGEGEDAMAGLEDAGRAHPVDPVRPSPGDIAVLIYTSGTTGSPKGVLLSHGNFTSNVLAGVKMMTGLGPDSRCLSILPYAHSFGQTAELYNMIYNGGSIGFAENVTTVAEDLGKVRPTLLIGVPRLFNRIYDGVWAKMNEAGGMKKKLFVMAVESAKARREMADKGGAGFMTELKYKIGDALVFKKIRERFGGRLDIAVSGSATMNVEIGHFFADAGIPVYDCYGLSETSPAATMNSPMAHRPGSVGRAIEHVRIEIDKSLSPDGGDEGEIIIYGPNVMQGYHKDPEATRATMTEDGGLRTGDMGRLDADGFLFITGRIKEQYKLENGKYVFPAALEEEIKLSPWAANAMVYGYARPYNVCLLVPDFEVLEQYARSHDLPTDRAALIAHPGVQEMIATAITDALKDKFRGYEIPRKFLWAAEDFSMENGMLTQTMKLKRRAVMAVYQEGLEALYRE